MIDLLPEVRDPDALAQLLPPPGTERQLKRGGAPRFSYPIGCAPEQGPVVITHRSAGGFELRVRRATNPHLRGRVAQLFAEGVLSFTSPDEVRAFFVDELRAAWRSGPGGTLAHADNTGVRTQVDEAAVTALRRSTPRIPTADYLAQALGRRIVGQEAPLRLIAAGTARHLRKQSPQAPYSALLIGPTGVGKTEAALQLATTLATVDPARGWRAVMVNCGEITGEDQLNRVLGAAPGYVGHDQGSPIADALGGGPAILVFDEIEKAHPSLLNRVLLGLLDRGRFSIPNARRGEARDADARGSLVLFTSNLAVADLAPGASQDDLRDHLRRHGLRPELVGRLRDVVQFATLEEAGLIQAACLAVDDLLAEYDLRPRTLAPAFLARVLDAHDERSGVRGVRVEIERRLEPSLEPLLDSGYRGPVDVGSACTDDVSVP